MNEAQQKMHDLFNAYKNSSQFKDAAMIEIISRKQELESLLNEMWSIYLSGNFKQLEGYFKQVNQIKDAGLRVLRNDKTGKHLIDFKKD